MPRKNRIDSEREAEADELLLRALRQLADEALEEEIPERLLRPLREARARREADGGAGPEAARGRASAEAGSGTREPGRSRGRAGSR